VCHFPGDNRSPCEDSQLRIHTTIPFRDEAIDRGRPGELISILGINYLDSTIQRIVSKTYREARDEIVRGVIHGVPG
jgi:hypothetical protein